MKYNQDDNWNEIFREGDEGGSVLLEVIIKDVLLALLVALLVITLIK